jgi:hypothetical protein
VSGRVKEKEKNRIAGKKTEDFSAFDRDIKEVENNLEKYNLEEVKRAVERLMWAIKYYTKKYGDRPKFLEFRERVSVLVEKRKALGDWDKPKRRTPKEIMDEVGQDLRRESEKWKSKYPLRDVFIDEEGNYY